MFVSMISQKSLERALEKAVTAAGSKSELARRLSIKVQSIQQWRCVPAKRLLEIERVTGVSRQELRPDLYADRAVRP